MLRRIIQMSILMVGLLAISTAWATTYYIDWASGLDTNDGLSKSTPWKRAPGMKGCSVGDTASNCNTKRVARGVAGDRFILKGGVTWPRAALSWDWYFGSGTEANPIYFGVDQSWYSGASWTRPILDAEAGLPNASPQGVTSMMRLYGNWFIVDNIEFTGLAQLNDTGLPNMLAVGTSVSANSEVKNCYFHGWSHGGTATEDRMQIITSALNSEPDMDLKIHHNVIDGWDTTKDMAMAYKGSAGHFYNNYIANMRNGLVFRGLYVWGNTFYNLDVSFGIGSHGNVIENLAAQSIIYNNYINMVNTGTTIFAGPEDGWIDYIFNNVIISQRNAAIQINNASLSIGVGAGIYVFNNTIQSPAGDQQKPINGPTRTGYPNLPYMAVYNNHLLADNPTVYFGTKVTTQTGSNNIGMTNAEATSTELLATGTYPFYPPAGSTTMATGMDLRSIAAGIPSTTTSDAATAALRDTSCGVKYDATNHRVIGPNRTSVVRGTMWDVGAYQIMGSQISPPRNLKITP